MLNSTSHNPDVLSCLANLSNDEVFTPPQLANQILDLLPQELWSDKRITFLDPVCKSGVFLREIARRLDAGLEKQIPDRQKRLNHIFKNQVFGLAITELTSLLSRRSVYCSKTANGKYSICDSFDSPAGNILFKRIKHQWSNGKCKYCGASQEVYDKGEELETHAYQFIHTDKPEEIFNMKFDVIVGNPPYQLEVGVQKDNYSVPLYHNFVRQAIKLNPRYLSMIIPSRWFAGGRGLDEFRNEMLKDDRIRTVVDYPEAVECFPGTQIKGGVCYLLWDRDNRGLCNVRTHLNGEVSAPVNRPLLESGCDVFIRYNESITILHKLRARGEACMAALVSPQTPFGFVTSFKGRPQSVLNDVPMYTSAGVGYVCKKSIVKGSELVSKHKVFIPKAGSGSDSFPHSILGKPFVGKPGTICNQTYLAIGPLLNQDECKNLITYIETRFFRFAVMLRKNTQDAMRGTYAFVPQQDFSEPWTDAKLYKKYGLTKEEIVFIESMVRPMESADE